MNTHCSISRHEAMKADPAIWSTLPHLQIWKYPWGEVHEMRDCPTCRSTLVIVIEKGSPPA